VLWGVPQLTDAGIALYYNADLLAAAGIDPAQLNALRWSRDNRDTLRPLLARLTVDVDGHTADTPGFDARRVRQWGYNAANDPQGIYLNYIGSAGGAFQNGDRFAFDNQPATGAFNYLVGLINSDHVAPPASDTNDNGDFSRNQFLAGRMALFQSGTYNLATVAEHARFRWGLAMLPTGPAGRVSVTNGIAAAGNSASKHPDAVRQVLAWLGSKQGDEYLARRGTAIPAVLSAQRIYFDYWAAKGVNVTPFFAVLNGPRIPAPGGAGFAAGYQAVRPYFDEMFLGRSDVATTLRQAQAAANAAARR
jgi:multiple sugar transport system substrate-binding protein